MNWLALVGLFAILLLAVILLRTTTRIRPTGMTAGITEPTWPDKYGTITPDGSGEWTCAGSTKSNPIGVATSDGDFRIVEKPVKGPADQGDASRR